MNTRMSEVYPGLPQISEMESFKAIKQYLTAKSH